MASQTFTIGAGSPGGIYQRHLRGLPPADTDRILISILIWSLTGFSLHAYAIRNLTIAVRRGTWREFLDNSPRMHRRISSMPPGPDLTDSMGNHFVL